jgi:acetyl esterase/lipase
MNSSRSLRFIILVLVLCFVGESLISQEASPTPPAESKAKSSAKAKAPVKRPVPTVADFAYDTGSPRQVLDFWKAESTKPTPLVLLIHGGGWRGGDKSSWSETIIRPYLDEGISVAAINYRFIEQAMTDGVEPPVKGCLHDAARALQTLRAKASEWNIDPTRVGATGTSAGACTSLWLALHDDIADPNNADPVLRQSSRLSCVAVSGAQTSLDPKELRQWMPNAIYGGHAFGFAAKNRQRPEEFELLIANREKVLPWIKEYSPIELLTSDDPPLYLEYPRQKESPEIGKAEPDPTHSSMYGIQLAKRASAKGVEVLVVTPQQPSKEFPSMSSFLTAKLKQARSKP